VSILPGQLVEEAYIQFQTDTATTDSVQLMIAGELSTHPSNFGNVAASWNISSRAITTSRVEWTPSAWNVEGEVSAVQRTPNLKQVSVFLVS
jgi:hypothetical protein